MRTNLLIAAGALAQEHGDLIEGLPVVEGFVVVGEEVEDGFAEFPGLGDVGGEGSGGSQIGLEQAGQLPRRPAQAKGILRTR